MHQISTYLMFFHSDNRNICLRHHIGDCSFFFIPYEVTAMETTYWRDDSIAEQRNDPVDLVSFLCNAYEQEVPFIDTTSPNIKHPLGRGKSAAVHLFRLGYEELGFNAKTQKIVRFEAGREIAIKSPTISQEQKAMLNELRVLSNSHLRTHANVVKLLGWSIRADKWTVGPQLVLEASSLGDLSTYLRQTGPGVAAIALKLSIDVVQGIQAIHSVGVVHGDIKSSNVLLFPDLTGLEQSYTAKICDFGFSIIASDCSESDDRVGLARSIPFNAPEVQPENNILLSDAYRADIFSCGMVLWDIWSCGFVSKSKPDELDCKKSRDGLVEDIKGSVVAQKDSYRLTSKQTISLCDLLQSCLDTNVSQRTNDLSWLKESLHTVIANENGLYDTFSAKSISGGLNADLPVSEQVPVSARLLSDVSVHRLSSLCPLI